MKTENSSFPLSVSQATVLEYAPQNHSYQGTVYDIKEKTPDFLYHTEGNAPDLRLDDITKFASDAEWQTVRHLLYPEKYGYASFLTIQVKLINDKKEVSHLLFWSDTLPKPDITSPQFIKHTPKCTLIYGDIQNLDFFGIVRVLGFTWKAKTQIKALGFFSLTDYVAIYGRETIHRLLVDGSITKTRSFRGVIPATLDRPESGIVDLYGMANSSLEVARESVSMDCKAKRLPIAWGRTKLPLGSSDNACKKYTMENMRLWAEEYTQDFLEYGFSDVDLDIYWERKVKLNNDIIKLSLGFEPKLTEDNCPRSSGSFTSLIFNKYLANRYPALVVAINALHLPSSKTKNDWRSFMEALKGWDYTSYKGLKPFEYLSASKKKGKLVPVPINVEHPERNFQLQGGEGSISGMSGGSIRALGSMTDTTACMNAIVQGGRCVNEQPNRPVILQALDPDMRGCYATSLTKYCIPMGLPTTLESSRDVPLMLMGDVLKKIGFDLVKNCWTFTVRTRDGFPLTFDQDFVYSKIGISEVSIKKDLTVLFNDDYEDVDGEGYREVAMAHIEGDFVLLRREIENGIITSDILETIQKISTNSQLKEWMNIEVISAAYYPKSQMVTENEMIEELCTNPGSVTTFAGRAVDKRTRKWFPVPLLDFIGNLAKARKDEKKLKVTKGDIHDIQQNAFKLIINTFYGCTASPYFAMGNAIIANNITANARRGAWMMAKALGSIQSITDGGACSALTVRFLELDGSNKDKPGFGVLANCETLEKHRNIRVGVLLDQPQFIKDYKFYSENKMYKELGELCDVLDATAKNHIDTFWSHYGLTFDFEIEHKYGNTSESCSAYAKADNMFIKPISPDVDFFGDIPYAVKCRGTRNIDANKRLMLGVMAGTIPYEEYEKVRTNQPTDRLMGCGERGLGLKFASIPIDVLPCDTMYETRNHLPNTDHAPIATVEVYRKRKNAADKTSRLYNKNVEEGKFVMTGDCGELIKKLEVSPEAFIKEVQKQVEVKRLKGTPQ